MATTDPRTAIGPDSFRLLSHGVSWDDYEAMLRIVGDRPIFVTYDQGTMEVIAPTAPDSFRLLSHGVSWDDYEAMLRIVGDRPIRVTYDRGDMEIMSPLWIHGSREDLLGLLVRVITEELDIPIAGAGPVTFKRQDQEKGAEPDRCYYLRENAERVRVKKRLDMGVDPPPDLIIEMDVTSSSLDRMGIFAALGIPEVWRYDGEDLQFLHLQADGTYRPGESSRNFPSFPVTEAARFLGEAESMDDTAWIKAFRAYVRDVLVPRAQAR
jgi:Uma2 family endonuclease